MCRAGILPARSTATESANIKNPNFNVQNKKTIILIKASAPPFVPSVFISNAKPVVDGVLSCLKTSLIDYRLQSLLQWLAQRRAIGYTNFIALQRFDPLL